MSGLYNPLHAHPKLNVVILGYLKSSNINDKIIPNVIEQLCKLFSPNISWSNDVNDNVLTVTGDFSGDILKIDSNASVIMNILAIFSGLVKCVNGGNIFIQSEKYVNPHK